MNYKKAHARSRIFSFFWIFFLFLLQNVLSYIFPVKAPLLLIGVIFFALSEGPFFGMALGVFAGVLLEIFAAGPLGYQIIFMAFCGGSAGYISSKIFGDNLLIRALLPNGLFYLVTLANLLVLKIQAGESVGPSVLFAAILPLDWLAIAVLSPFVFSFLTRVSSPRFR